MKLKIIIRNRKTAASQEFILEGDVSHMGDEPSMAKIAFAIEYAINETAPFIRAHADLVE